MGWQDHVENTMGIPWNSMRGLLDGWMAWRPSMARPCGEHHGHPMEFHGRVDSWMGGWQGGLPWQGHVENTMGIPWNSMGDSWMGGWHGGLPMARPCGEHHGHPMEFHGGEGRTPGWVDGMEAFHGKTMWRTPWASHGIPWGDSWMGGWHGGLPWQGHVENTMGIT